MSYLALLAIFLVAPAAALAVVVRWRVRDAGLALRSLLVLVPVAMVYTLPWDRWMIDRGVFGYSPAAVRTWIAGVPLADLLLFALQSVLVGLWSVLVAGRRWRAMPCSRRAVRAVRAALVGLLVGLLAGTVAAGLLADTSHLRYVTGIVVWFGPLLVLQTALGADVLLARRHLWLAAVGPATAWLWLVEIVALRHGIWWVAAADSLPARPDGVPWEDLLIFLVGTVFVAQTVIYAIDPVMRARARAWGRSVRSAITRLPVPSEE